MIRALHRRKGREEAGRFLVQGAKLLRELLASGWPVEAIHATAEAAERLMLKDAVIHPPHVLERMGTLESGNEVVAVVPIPPVPVLDVPGEGELLIALDGIADPGNLGTLLRIADWFGVGRMLISHGSVDLFNPKCVQASMGALFRVGVERADLATRLDALRAAGATLYLATMDGAPVFDLALQRPAVLVLGSESHGLSSAVRGLGGTAIAVPRVGGSESLNVSMAASALCMEFTRQALSR